MRTTLKIDEPLLNEARRDRQIRARGAGGAVMWIPICWPRDIRRCDAVVDT
jgi:hypothetical protein